MTTSSGTDSGPVGSVPGRGHGREHHWLEAFEEAKRVEAAYNATEAALVLMDAADEEQQRLLDTIFRLQRERP